MRKYNEHRFFVIAAVVAAELYRATQVAREITLTACNARALALRAGQRAAGFRALTDFIDELAARTVSASKTINGQAINMSRLASETARIENTLQRFELAYSKGEEAKYIHSIDKAYQQTRREYDHIWHDFEKHIWQLQNHLEELARELRTATVLSAMSRVEASQVDKELKQSLNVIAENVAQAAKRIQEHVHRAQHLFMDLGSVV